MCRSDSRERNAVGCVQCVDELGTVFVRHVAAGALEEEQCAASGASICVGKMMDDRQRHLALFGILADALTDGVLASEQIEDVVLNLEGDAHAATETIHGLPSRCVREAARRA
jgi:hypothetical protein